MKAGVSCVKDNGSKVSLKKTGENYMSKLLTRSEDRHSQGNFLTKEGKEDPPAKDLAGRQGFSELRDGGKLGKKSSLHWY